MGRLVVLGATGMLGSAVMSLAIECGMCVVGTTTNLSSAPEALAPLVEFKYRPGTETRVFDGLGSGDYVINCAGLIKHHIDDMSLEQRQRAIELNALFPHALAELAETQGFRVLQIATDCVFSGLRGMYTEADLHDASDVYGQSKSLGEVPSENLMHIRCSIIGRELRSHLSLLDWAILQPAFANLSGYADHIWNGVTTRAFARVAIGLLQCEEWKAGTFHLIPADIVTKHELLKIVLREFGREDISLHATITPLPIDRSLGTADTAMNRAMWRAGGYKSPPTVAQMIAELTTEETNR